MSADVLLDGNVVGVAGILATLQVHGPLIEPELLDVCGGYGLRAGAISWRRALSAAKDLRLVVADDAPGSLVLSGPGQALSVLTTRALEPTDEFVRAYSLLWLARSPKRYVLGRTAIVGDRISDPISMAAPILAELTEAGVVLEAEPTQWAFKDETFSPLLIGLMLTGPRGTPLGAEVGDVGERLTLKYYDELGCSPIRVSQVSDAFGFDILCRQRQPSNVGFAVEAKATTASGLRFFVSRHELRVARQLRTRYTIAVWGSVKVDEPLEANYGRLRGAGYPRLIQDPYDIITKDHAGLLEGLPVVGGAVAADGLVWSLSDS